MSKISLRDYLKEIGVLIGKGKTRSAIVKLEAVR
jgi:hypothetical protein